MNTIPELVPLVCAVLLCGCGPDNPPTKSSDGSSTSTSSTPSGTTTTGDTTTTDATTTTPIGGTFSYDPVGQLKVDKDGNTTGTGDADATVWGDSIRFPLKCAPAFANSQVYNLGGMNYPGGWCDDANYKYPWQDNFCETRANQDQTAYVCPQKAGIHQGQDIRANTRCDNKGHSDADGTFWTDSDTKLWRTKYQAVAVEDGYISHIGTYSLYLEVTKDGEPRRNYTYLHMHLAPGIVEGQNVTKGMVLGTVSNEFGVDSHGNPKIGQTNPHLHFEIRTVIEGTNGTAYFTFVSPYMTLVSAYQRLLAAGNDVSCPADK